MIPQDAGKPDPSSHSFPPPREAGPIAGRIGEGPIRQQFPGAPAPAAPPGLSAAPDLWSLLLALRHRWISAVILSALLGTVAAGGAWYLLTPKSTAFARVQVAFVVPVVNQRVHEQNDFKTYLQTTAAKMTGRPVIWAALKRDEVRKLNLLADRDIDSVVQGIEEDLKVEFKESSEILTLQYSHNDPHIATVLTNAIKEAYVSEYSEAETRRKHKRMSDIEQAAGIARLDLENKTKALQKVGEKIKGTTTKEEFDPRDWRDAKYEAVRRLNAVQKDHGDIKWKLIEAKSNLKVLKAKINAIKGYASGDKTGKSSRDEPDVNIAPFRKPKAPTEGEIESAVEQAVDRDPAVRQLRADIVPIAKEVARNQAQKVREDNLGYKRARESLARLRAEMSRQISSIEARARESINSQYAQKVESAYADYQEKAERLRAEVRDRGRYIPTAQGGRVLPTDEEMEAESARIQDQIEQLEKADKGYEKLRLELNEIASRSGPGLEYEAIEAEIKMKKVALEEATRKVDAERLEMKAALRVTRMQDAELLKKETKKQLLATAVAPLAALFGVCGGLALLEHRKRKVRSATEISRGLGIRVVGAVPKMAHLERHLVGPTGESDLEGTPVMESIDAIRTRLLHEADVRATRVVLVTSATAGEGKTTLAAALASSLARAGRRTLLLDGDLRRPTVHELFEVPMQPGFSEVLLGEIEVAEAAVESMQENLSILPAGQWDREVLLALSRDGLEGVFEKLSEEFDFIIVDSHPVLAATDTLLLGRQADAVVLSVLREISQMPRVYAAHQQLTTIGIRVLGAVVNGTNPEEVYATAAPAMATA